MTWRLCKEKRHRGVNQRMNKNICYAPPYESMVQNYIRERQPPMAVTPVREEIPPGPPPLKVPETPGTT
jgi:hypothetical protein